MSIGFVFYANCNTALNENDDRKVTTEVVDNSKFDWTNVIEAIIQVESKGNTRAVSKDGTCVGVLQIKTVLVRDCNQYLTMKKSKKRFTYKDRYDREKSIEMFLLIQERYNKTNNVEKAIRMWNGGPYYSVRKTNKYYNKVMAKLKLIQHECDSIH